MIFNRIYYEYRQFLHNTLKSRHGTELMAWCALRVCRAIGTAAALKPADSEVRTQDHHSGRGYIMTEKTFLATMVLFLIAGLGLGGAPGAQAAIYFADNSAQSVAAFPNIATGNVAPTSVIAGANTTFSAPQWLAVDATSVYVSDISNNAILVFPNGATGNVGPSRTIAGISTTLSGPEGVAVDGTSIYVANSGTNSILVFPIGASGNAAPSRTIAGAATTLTASGGIAVDGTSIYVTNPATNAILVFPIGASGNFAPTQTISGANTLLHLPVGVAVDAASIYVTNASGPSIGVFPKGANGNAAPSQSITGIFTTLITPEGVAVDNASIYVTNPPGHKVLAFVKGATGNVAPAQTISGLATTLSVPIGVATDPVASGGGCQLDLDGNGPIDALTDGLMIVRFLLGSTGAAVTNGAVGASASRTTWAQIQPVINATALDVDGNGVTDAQTDGLLIIRALFGLTGTAVTNGSIGGGATRSDWATIRSYLNGNCGTNFAL
jgi:hypothetical protein